MKDQLRLLRDCINNDRPAVVFQGDDFALLRSWRQQKKFIVGTFIKYYKISQLIHTQSIAN